MNKNKHVKWIVLFALLEPLLIELQRRLQRMS